MTDGENAFTADVTRPRSLHCVIAQGDRNVRIYEENPDVSVDRQSMGGARFSPSYGCMITEKDRNGFLWA
jgi:hypothetical protein